MEKIIHFTKYRFIALAFSVVMIIGFFAGSYFRGGLNYGIDFVGGYKLVVKFEDKSANEGTIRSALSEFSPTVQQIGEADKNEYIISTKIENKVSEGTAGVAGISKYDLLKNTLSEKFKNVVIESEENVGPAIGDFLKKSAWKLSIIAIVMMSLYLAFRFEVKFAVGAMAALFHDILASIAFCGLTGIEINIPVIAAFLTIFGYSVNDTIVVFDRIRETNELKGKETYNDVIDKAITQTLTRTLITALTTLFAILSLYFIGGEVLNDFALVLLFGITIGTYSSIFIASPTVLAWEKWRLKK